MTRASLSLSLSLSLTLSLSLSLTLSGCALSHELGIDGGPHDAPPALPVLSPCISGGMSGTNRDCGWSSGGGVACRPGATVQIGCDADCGLGSCSGDSMLRICDTAPCTASQALATNDDSCGTVCSFIDGVTCPASGQIFVLTAPFSAGMPFHCNFVVR